MAAKSWNFPTAEHEVKVSKAQLAQIAAAEAAGAGIRILKGDERGEDAVEPDEVWLEKQQALAHEAEEAGAESLYQRRSLELRGAVRAELSEVHQAVVRWRSGLSSRERGLHVQREQSR